MQLVPSGGDGPRSSERRTADRLFAYERSLHGRSHQLGAKNRSCCQELAIVKTHCESRRSRMLQLAESDRRRGGRATAENRTEPWRRKAISVVVWRCWSDVTRSLGFARGDLCRGVELAHPLRGFPLQCCRQAFVSLSTMLDECY